MAKFMSAELIRIRDSLSCGHCGCTFRGSDSQAWKVKYEKKTVYCSDACRKVAMSNKFSTPIPNRGPCPTCKSTFFSRREKIYCSLDCYVKSPQFQATSTRALQAASTPEARAKLSATLRTGTVIQCLECGSDVYQKKKGIRKFCTKACYRAYLAKRFDRWIANPEGMALPQCYDEFLDRETLPCVVDGCSWTGKHLTQHVNQAHGLRAEDFKRAAGFNLGTGVIAKPLAEILQGRPNQGVALADAGVNLAALASGRETIKRVGRYVSSEANEHRKKARALMLEEAGPTRICRGCNKEFRQKHTAGRALYCSIGCRDQHYARQKKSDTPRTRDASGRYLPKSK